MGTRSYPWGFILVTVALLLDPTSADVLVQPGYGQPVKSSKDSVVQSQSLKNQATVKSQQNYSPQQDPFMQILQQQHALEHQYLQQQHQQERNQLLQLQHQELQNPRMHQYQTGGQETVGMPWGMRPSLAYGPMGALGGSKFFHLGPLGLNSFRYGGGLGSMGFPLLLSPHQAGQMQGSTQLQKSMDGPTQPRTRRDVRESGESSGKKYRQKNTRVQQDGVATNPTLKSKADSTSENTQTSKTNDQIVGDASNNHNEENVGSSILDPLGLADKAVEFMDDLKSGHLPNPLHALTNGGHFPGRSNYLNKGNTQTSQFEEHVVGQSQQYQYPQQVKYNTMMNQQQLQSQGSPIVGDAKRRQYPPYPYGPPPSPGLYGPPGAFNTPYPYPYRPSQSPYRPSPVWLLGSTSNQRTGSPYEVSSAYGAQNPSSVQTNWGNPMTGSANPAIQNPTYRQITGAQNPAVAKPQMMTENANVGAGQSSSSAKNSMGNDQIVGASNPKATGGYEQIVGASNPADSLYQLARAVQPMMGTVLNSMTGSAGPAGFGGGATPYNYQPGGRNMMGDPMVNSFYDPGRHMNYYGQERHIPFDLDDMYDDRYHNHHMHHGGYNRIYDTFDETPYGYGGGYPHHMHNHEGYIF